jgi:hypothetical protein
MSGEELIVLRVEQLFSKYSQKDTEEELSLISEYLAVLAAKIDIEELNVTVTHELLKNFNAVVLLLRDRLLLYPENFQAQILELLTKSDAERIFDVISVSSPAQLARMLHPSRSISRVLFEGLDSWRGKRELDPRAISVSNLFDAKVALNKLAQLTKYLSTIEIKNYEPEWQEFSDHFNPNLLDKQKLLALVDRLKGGILGVDDLHVQRRIQEYVEKLETEIRRTKPRWGRIIAGFFVVLSFVADLKTVSPGVYDSVYNDVLHILTVVTQDSGVERQRQVPYLPQEYWHATIAVLPEPPKIKREI